MRRIHGLIVTCFLLLFVGSTGVMFGQDNTISFSDSAILNRLKTDISMLASDSLEGREAGTRGDTLASAYIIDRFLEIGLLPRGTEPGSYLQPFPYVATYHEWSENFLATDYDVYRFRKDFGMTSLSASDKVDAIILSVGYGVSDSLLWDDYSEVPDPSEKALLMEIPLPKEYASDSSIVQQQSIRFRVGQAFRRGAAAVLLWNSDSPEYASLFNFDDPEPMPGPVIFIAEPVARELRRLEGQPVRLGARINRIETNCNNLLGWLDNHAAKTVIIGAHYDHVGLNQRGNARCGADDNASGVAMMLELARFFSQRPDSSFNYLFVAFGAEEKGLIGSSYFCDHPIVPLDEVAYMCNFDMVGRLGAEGNRITLLATGTSPQWKPLYKSMPKFPFRVKRLKGPSSFSDQECFYKKSIPIFYLTTGLHPDYHTYRDRPNRINYTGMVPIAKFAEEFIVRTEKIGTIEFREVSPWTEFGSDLSYYFKQIGHLFDMPLQDMQ
ncbi:M28 family peptidase [Bacteroidota bacterium]